MRIENGQMVLEQEKCWCCEDGTEEVRVRRACETCKGTGRGKRGGWQGCKGGCHGLGYQWYSTHERTSCHKCKGSTFVDEDVYSTRIPENIWRELPFKVHRVNRGMTWEESYLGVGCFSVTDYGTAWNSDDDHVIESVKRDRGVQACKIVNSRDDLTVADEIAIIVTRGGYTVVGVRA